MDRYSHILGCLLGTALGDAVGLAREGLSRTRAERLHGGPPLRPNLAFGRGFCSDDTEHTQIVGRALALFGGDAGGFERELCRQLKRWMLTLPAGIGWGTLRACVKLLLGFGPRRSGVSSAGNGPAMRSALIGVCAASDWQLRDFVRVASHVTHTDPRAEEGAYLVARAAGLAVQGMDNDPVRFLGNVQSEVQGQELRRCLSASVAALAAGQSPRDFADSQGWSRGVSGYVNQTVPAALYCWANAPRDFRGCVENAVMLGGDSDSVGAIAGAVCGANLGSENLPREWLDRLGEWPRGIEWMRKLAVALSSPAYGPPHAPPGMCWIRTVPRNLVFAAIVLGIGFRRLLPPYGN